MATLAETRVALRGMTERSWDTLYERFRPTFVRALVGACGTFEGVEDAVQEAFEEGMRREPQVDNLEGWLYVVGLNRMRRSRRMRFFSELPPMGSADALAEAATRIDLVRTLSRLRRRERELLIAKYYLGMTQDQIAGLFRLRRGTVSSALARAAERFREVDR
jgi:RNA polymerase sigma factor (sigma-70 family)